MKSYIKDMAILSPPHPSEHLLYVVASKAPVSATLVHEVTNEKGKSQHPIYFVSKALSGLKLLYFVLEKIAYAVIMASRKIRHYLRLSKSPFSQKTTIAKVFLVLSKQTCISKVFLIFSKKKLLCLKYFYDYDF